MTSQPPHLIGIAGPSGSGKTALAQCLAQRLPPEAVLIALDSYYRDLSDRPIEARAHANFDRPDALDDALLIAQLDALAHGRTIEKPTYDFATHTRTHAVERVAPAPFILVEGLFTLYWPPVRALLHTKVFLTLEPGVCLERRTYRDVRERGRSPESVHAQFLETTLPMYRQYIEPTRLHADLVLSGADPLDTLAERVLAHIAEHES